MNIRLLYLRAKNFVRTGSFALPALASNISTAAQADIKLAEAKAKLDAHDAAIVVKKVAHEALSSRANVVKAKYADIEADAHSLLKSL